MNFLSQVIHIPSPAPDFGGIRHRSAGVNPRSSSRIARPPLRKFLTNPSPSAPSDDSPKVTNSWNATWNGEFVTSLHVRKNHLYIACFQLVVRSVTFPSQMLITRSHEKSVFPARTTWRGMGTPGAGRRHVCFRCEHLGSGGSWRLTPGSAGNRQRGRRRRAKVIHRRSSQLASGRCRRPARKTGER